MEAETIEASPASEKAPTVEDTEILRASLRLAHQRIVALETQLIVAQKAACLVLGLDFETLREQSHGV